LLDCVRASLKQDECYGIGKINPNTQLSSMMK
jgi:hypothetical protein